MVDVGVEVGVDVDVEVVVDVEVEVGVEVDVEVVVDVEVEVVVDVDVEVVVDVEVEVEVDVEVDVGVEVVVGVDAVMLGVAECLEACVAAKWLTGDALGFDLETTGVDVTRDRIVTACAVNVGGGGSLIRGKWLLNPGVEIPAEATAVHGISTEKARAEGADPTTALPAIRQQLMDASAMGLPLIIMNASFDLGMTQCELARYGFSPLIIGPVLDPLVIDRAIDPYRKGKRTLSALAQHYGVKQDGAHSSEGDALTAARVVWRMASHPKAPQISLDEMQEFQRVAHAKWAEGFEAYLRDQGKNETISREWPVRT